MQSIIFDSLNTLSRAQSLTPSERGKKVKLGRNTYPPMAGKLQSRHFNPYLHSFLPYLCPKPCGDSNPTQSKSQDLTVKTYMPHLPPSLHFPFPLLHAPSSSLCSNSQILLFSRQANGYSLRWPGHRYLCAPASAGLCRALRVALPSPDSVPAVFSQICTWCAPSPPAGLSSRSQWSSHPRLSPSFLLFSP